MRRFALAFAALVALGAACGQSNPRAQLITHHDAGPDGAVDGGPTTDSSDRSDAPADASPYLGGPCVDDAQCDDQIACTYDSCDASLGRCLDVPDDTQCQDGMYCNGQEQCVPGHGCEPGPVVSCDDGNPCHIATCVEATKSCTYADRDIDGDGDPDAHCDPGHDCDDLNPDVSSLHAEICANGIDDNCNGQVDEQPCVSPQGDTCADAIAVGGAGTYVFSTVGANDTFATSCSVTIPTAGENVVAAVTIPPGANVDLEVWVSGTTEVAVAIQGTCGDPSSERACGSGTGATDVRARARNVTPGTYFAIVTTQAPGTVQLQVDLLAPTSPPTDVDCATATPIQPGTATTVSIVNPPTVLPTSCAASTGSLTYSFTLGQPQDVHVFASTLQGSGTPVIGLRNPHCTDAVDELECETAGTVPLFERSLPAGTYVVTVGATSPSDVTLDVELSPPTTAPPDQTCTAPPAITPNATLDFDLSGHENAIKDGCAASGPDAAYDLSLAAASDVLLVQRFPETETGSVSLDTPTCDLATTLGCTTSGTPARLAKRNVPAGDYRVVIADELGFQGTLQALVRPTVAPTIVPPGGADTCAQAVDASNGGFFTGDTSTANADYGESCDAPGLPPGGAPDQVLALNLTQNQRVVLDMEGSTYSTLLSVWQGPACPGNAVPNACYVGFNNGSFLDLELTPGQYWLILDGYNGGKGAWDLDVRILPP
jgi:hypothetical protein